VALSTFRALIQSPTMASFPYTMEVLLATEVPLEFPETLLWQGPLVVIAAEGRPLVLPSPAAGILSSLLPEDSHLLPVLDQIPLENSALRAVSRLVSTSALL
jgi:hypothetical protein